MPCTQSKPQGWQALPKLHAPADFSLSQSSWRIAECSTSSEGHCCLSSSWALRSGRGPGQSRSQASSRSKVFLLISCCAFSHASARKFRPCLCLGTSSCTVTNPDVASQIPNLSWVSAFHFYVATGSPCACHGLTHTLQSAQRPRH